MSQIAVLRERKEKRKRGTASEPVRVEAALKPSGSLVHVARKPKNPLARASRRILGGTAHHLASAAWHTFQAANRMVPSARFQPRWAPAPLLKSSEQSKPPLGFPRETDSLCPKCVLEIRAAINDADEIKRYLRHVGLPEHPPPIAPARYEHRELGLSFDESPYPQDEVQVTPDYH